MVIFNSYVKLPEGNSLFGAPKTGAKRTSVQAQVFFTVGRSKALARRDWTTYGCDAQGVPPENEGKNKFYGKSF